MSKDQDSLFGPLFGGDDDALPWQTPGSGGDQDLTAPKPRREPRREDPMPSPPPAPAPEVDPLAEVRSRVHKALLKKLNFSNLDALDRDEVKAQITRVVEEMARKEGALNGDERTELVRQVLDEIFGLGPLEPLLKDPTVSEIMVNTHEHVWVERGGRLQETDVRFKDEQHLRQIIDRIVSNIGRRIDESSPICDARLADGSRVAAMIPPISLDGSHLTIRKFKKEVLGPEALLNYGSITEPMLELLRGAVEARLNILISGGTGSGKTTLLNILSSYIPPNDERIITIEDAAELQLRHPHVFRMETRPANIEGTGEITQRDLVKASLRHRPERIILGEIRSGEAVDMLQAMNTGHDGSLATIHANNPREALTRLETMIAMAGLNLPDKAMRQQVASAIHLIIQIRRFSDGSRKVTHVSEIVGMEGDVIQLQDIFLYEQTGVDPETRKVLGRFRATGIRPKFAEMLEAKGISLPEDLFWEG